MKVAHRHRWNSQGLFWTNWNSGDQQFVGSVQYMSLALDVHSLAFDQPLPSLMSLFQVACLTSNQSMKQSSLHTLAPQSFHKIPITTETTNLLQMMITIRSLLAAL